MQGNCAHFVKPTKIGRVNLLSSLPNTSHLHTSAISQQSVFCLCNIQTYSAYIASFSRCKEDKNAIQPGNGCSQRLLRICSIFVHPRSNRHRPRYLQCPATALYKPLNTWTSGYQTQSLYKDLQKPKKTSVMLFRMASKELSQTHLDPWSVYVIFMPDTGEVIGIMLTYDAASKKCYYYLCEGTGLGTYRTGPPTELRENNMLAGLPIAGKSSGLYSAGKVNTAGLDEPILKAISNDILNKTQFKYSSPLFWLIESLSTVSEHLPEAQVDPWRTAVDWRVKKNAAKSVIDYGRKVKAQSVFSLWQCV
ncbi:hypothetical protein DFH11DRAFT_1548944 [Phellopilus nigrolimitatus]|nr:hypothetical protein DFH11DRAFT_1548944 [Phellopilus nigrolimitatus]